MREIPLLSWLLFGLGLVPCMAGAASLDDRVTVLERRVNSGTLVQLLDRVEHLQAEVRELRGLLEQQDYELKQLKQRQRDLYLDVDRRLQRLEAGAPVQAPVSAVPPPDTPQPATSPPPGVVPAPIPEAPTGPTSQPPGPGAAMPPGFDPAKEYAAYQKAFDLLKEGRYEQAAKAFKGFLATYPGGQYADNAQYWLGEAYYVTRQFQPALEAFQGLADQYPDSPKRSHALLKIGYIEDELGRGDDARKVLEDLVERYPKSTAARLARERLQRMKLESR